MKIIRNLVLKKNFKWLTSFIGSAAILDVTCAISINLCFLFSRRLRIKFGLVDQVGFRREDL